MPGGLSLCKTFGQPEQDYPVCDTSFIDRILPHLGVIEPVMRPMINTRHNCNVCKSRQLVQL